MCFYRAIKRFKHVTILPSIACKKFRLPSNWVKDIKFMLTFSYCWPKFQFFPPSRMHKREIQDSFWVDKSDTLWVKKIQYVLIHWLTAKVVRIFRNYLKLCRILLCLFFFHAAAVIWKVFADVAYAGWMPPCQLPHLERLMFGTQHRSGGLIFHANLHEEKCGRPKEELNAGLES